AVPLAVTFLADLILLKLLVQVAARRADHFGRARDVPAVLAELLHQEGALGRLLELTQRPGFLARSLTSNAGTRASASRAARPGRTARVRLQDAAEIGHVDHF